MQLRFHIPLSAALCLGLPSLVFGQFAGLSSKVQQGSNAMVAMDVAALQQTALAQQEGWTKKLEAAFVNRAVFLPPEADKLLVASHLSADEHFVQDWENAVITLNKPLSMPDIARAEGGYVDQIDGKDAIWSPSGAYLVAFDNETLGIMSPANRQAVGRWVDEASTNPGDTLSPYLQGALDKVQGETQIVMAIDLTNAVSPHRVEDRLKNSEVLAKSSLQVPDMVKLMVSLQGATIEVSVGDKARAKTRIDFGQPVKIPEVIAKRLVLEALDRLGVQLTDLADHKFSVLGNSIHIEGDMSSGGLRRLFSVLEVPTTHFSELNEASAGDKAPSAGDMAQNSQVYFKSVTTLLDDLHGDRSKQDVRGGMDAVWMDKYARKIDRLPILHVDEDLLTFGSNCAETLRAMSGVRHNAGLTAGSEKSALRTGAYIGSYNGYAYGYGGAGYAVYGSSATANAKDRNQ
ncbi:MAG: hypothetical protein AB7U20_22435, partial [Planctomycetaceae bacterium]